MPIKFKPNFQITPEIASLLMRIESAKEKIAPLPISGELLVKLRETARLFSTHYSTMIEGNRLTQEEVEEAISINRHFPGRERDEREVRGYYAALQRMEEWVAKASRVSEQRVQLLHGLLMGDGSLQVKPTPYRDGQNVIREAGSRRIIYMPPEASDVAPLMKALIHWIQTAEKTPAPLVAAVTHYQFATIHPYYDGNGRTARLLTSYVLHLSGYGLKGLYSLEEYYAQNLGAYYEAISIGPSHNYYLGRAEADITGWVNYFCKGMAEAVEKVHSRMHQVSLSVDVDQEALLRLINPRQRASLELFYRAQVVTATQIGQFFGLKSRTASGLCQRWSEEGFLEIVDPSKRGRKYRLAPAFQSLICGPVLNNTSLSSGSTPLL